MFISWCLKTQSWLKKLVPSTLGIGTYTTDAVKIVGSCLFYLVHSDTKMLQEVTFYVAQNDGSVLLSCTTTLTLGLIQPCTRLDYLPPRASLITCSLDTPKKTKRCLFTAQEKKCLLKAKKQAVTVPDQQTTCSQVSYKQGANFTKIPRCFEGFQVPLSYPDISKYYTQADTCRPIQ